ncbi:MAG: serine/threonine-protein kinase [Nitrospinota bacterium]|nr:serine/threonine-protein kinase [Nitrospinota bacterium]
MADVPEYIGRYHIRDMIAKGGMGRIYAGWDDLIGRPVAIKVVDTSDKSQPQNDPEIVKKQFDQELRISGQLSNHSMVTIYDGGNQGSLYYLVMELLNGATLDTIINTPKAEMDMRQKLEILTQVGHALHYAHQRGVVHRDIKPSNIMVLKNGQVKVMDFGVAYTVEKSDVNLKASQLEIVGGTPFYMSPEQINKGKIDARSDVFSMAVVAYELLTGQRPFHGKNRFSLYEKILRSDPIPIKELNPSVPDKVAAIITLCLNKDARLRLQTAQSFADQIDETIHEGFFTSTGDIITQETMKILQQYRENFAFFFDLDNAQLYKLLQVCQTRDYKKGDLIFEEGSVARDMFLMISGNVRISRKMDKMTDTLVILLLQRGDIFGEMGIIDGAPRSASAYAETNCRVLALHQVSLLRCDDNTAGKLYRNLARILSSKLRATSFRLEEFSRRPGLS